MLSDGVDLGARFLLVRSWKWMVASCDLRWVHGLWLGSPFSPAQPWSRQDAPFPRWRWRDAVFEDPFGRSHGWIKFAEPRSDRPCGFTIAEQQAAIHFQLQTYAELCCVAWSVVP